MLQLFLRSKWRKRDIFSARIAAMYGTLAVCSYCNFSSTLKGGKVVFSVAKAEAMYAGGILMSQLFLRSEWRKSGIFDSQGSSQYTLVVKLGIQPLWPFRAEEKLQHEYTRLYPTRQWVGMWARAHYTHVGLLHPGQSPTHCLVG